MSREADVGASGRSLAVVFASALVLRGIVVLELSQAPFFSSLIGDGLGYHVWAERIAAGDWIGSGVFYQAPLYPYLLGILYSLTSADPLWVRLAQIVLEAFSCVLLAGAGARFFGSTTVGFLTGILASLYAPAIFFTTLVQKATLSFFLTSLVLNLLSRLHQSSRSRRRFLLLGLVLGLLALTRENTMIFILLLVPWLAVRVRGVGSRTLAVWIALLVLGASLPLVTVGVRNYVVGGDFTLTTSQFGTNFFIGNNANSKGFYLPLRFFRGNVKHERDDAAAMAEASSGRKLSPAEVSSFWTGQALEYIEENPVEWLGLMIRKSLLVWNRVEAADTEDIAAYRHFSTLLDIFARVFHFGLMVPLAAAGIWLTRRRWRELGILYAMMATYAASLTLFFLFARYRIPLVPPILIFAAVGTLELRDLIRSRDRREQLQTALVIGCAAVVANLPLTDTDTQLAASYKNFGTLMIEKENFPKAVEYFEKSIGYRPDVAETLRGMAESLADLGRFEESEDYYERLLVLEPDNFLGNLGLGRVLLVEGRLEEGIAKLELAAELEPGMAQPHRFLAIHYEERGQLVQARAAYLEILEREPKNSQARARVIRIQGEIERRRIRGQHRTTIP
jgi:tetratricopeptide (TPR) repeat protein